MIVSHLKSLHEIFLIAHLALYSLWISSVGGSLPVTFSYFSEFFSTTYRNRLIIILASFWILGILYASFMAWLLIPKNIRFSLGSLEVTSWRIFLMLCAFPCLSAAFLLLFMPESPNFLYTVTIGFDCLIHAHAPRGKPVCACVCIYVCQCVHKYQSTHTHGKRSVFRTGTSHWIQMITDREVYWIEGVWLNCWTKYALPIGTVIKVVFFLFL